MTAARLLPALLGCLLLAACTGGDPGGQPAAAPSASPEPPGLERVWTRDDVEPMTRPTVVGDRVLLYTHKAGTLRITALDPADGSTAWQAAASPSLITPGVELSVTSDDDLVFYLEPGRQRGTAVLVAADVTTGTPRWKGGSEAFFRGMPSECDDDPASLCALGVSELGETAMRFAKADGARTERERTADGSRELGAGLVDPGGRDPHRIERVDPGGTTLWSRPASEVFGVPDATSDTGWYLREYGDLAVGHLGRGANVPDASGAVVRDLTLATVLAGVDLATGDNRWSDPGASFRCYGVLDELLVDPDEERPLPFRCRSTGTTSLRPEVADAEVSPDTRTVVEGFDPATGATTWTADVGRVPALAFGGPGPMALGPTAVALPDGAGGSVRLDVSDGSTGEVEDGATGWCVLQLPDVALIGQLDPDTERQAAPLLVPCRADGTLLEAPAALDEDRSAVVAGTSVWADAGGVHGAREVQQG